MKTSSKSILGGRVEVIGPHADAIASHIEATVSKTAAAVQPLNPALDDPPTSCECPNCGWAGTDADMKRVYPDIPDLTQRVNPGEPVPVGECPECGALCHEVEAAEVAGVVAAQAQGEQLAKLRARNQQLAGLLAEAAGLADETARWLSGDESYDTAKLAVSLTKLAMDCREASNKVQSLKVLIEVDGGVAEVTTCPPGVEVVIVDHDNERR